MSEPSKRECCDTDESMHHRTDCTSWRPIEHDHEGIDCEAWFSSCGLCPACHKCKFIGHGPLCVDCYLRSGA